MKGSIVIVAVGLMLAGTAFAMRPQPQTHAPKTTAYHHASTGSPAMIAHPLVLHVGDTAAEFVAEMVPSSNFSPEARGAEDDRGTLLFRRRFARRLTLLEVINSTRLDSTTIAATANVQAAQDAYRKTAPFDTQTPVDSFGFDAGEGGAQRWLSSGRTPMIDALVQSAHTSTIAWGYESDEGMSALPHALRDVYAAGVYPAIILVDRHMSVLYVARGRAAADRRKLLAVVGQAVIDQDAEQRS